MLRLFLKEDEREGEKQKSNVGVKDFMNMSLGEWLKYMHLH